MAMARKIENFHDHEVVTHVRPEAESRGGRGPLDFASSPTTWAVIAFAAICWLHLWRLGTEGVATDENAYKLAGSQYIHGILRANLQHPPLAKELIGATQALFGSSWAAVRLSSALAGLATAVLLYFWARRTAGPWAGVAGLVLWGLLPQRAGFSGLLQLGISTRVDRFALLEPVATMFAALALWAGWEWMTHNSLWWASVAGAATGLAASAKAPGVLVALAIVGFALWSGFQHHWRTARQLAAYFVSGLGAVCVVYAPFGLHAALHQLAYMFAFQVKHAEEGHAVYLAGRIYGHAPWWAGLYFQTVGYGWLITSVGAFLIAAALFAGRPRRGVAYALTAAVSVYLGLNVGTRLELPFYYVLWQPALVFAAALGFDALRQHRQQRLLLLPLGATLAVPVMAFGMQMATLGPGAYERASELAGCQKKCAAYVVGYVGVLRDYVAGQTVVRDGLPAPGVFPDLVVADPDITLRQPDVAAKVGAWAAEAGRLGYRYVDIDGLRVWLGYWVLPPTA
jgi:4-amino-4-deoxy-L-arabinose transferase-like glycosyltransferase